MALRAIADSLRATLWPDGLAGYTSVYAILDGGRDRKVFGSVDACRLNKTCLYSVNVRWYGEDLRWSTIGTAPYMVELDRDDRFTSELLEEGWHNHWGIFFRSDSSLEKLRKHFRRFLTVSDQRGKKLLFRYYDPRVLRAYLPTCRREELEALFGPVSAFVTSGSEPETAYEFRFSGSRLTKRVVQLNEQALTGSYVDSREVQSLALAGAWHGAPMIRDAQMKALKNQRAREFKEKTLAHLRRFFPRRCAAAGDDRMLELIEEGIGRAARHGFQAERDVCRFIDLMVAFGARFDEDAQQGWAAEALGARRGMDELFSAGVSRLLR
jgi:hypothetical protein